MPIWIKNLWGAIGGVDTLKSLWDQRKLISSIILTALTVIWGWVQDQPTSILFVLAIVVFTAVNLLAVLPKIVGLLKKISKSLPLEELFTIKKVYMPDHRVDEFTTIIPALELVFLKVLKDAVVKMRILHILREGKGPQQEFIYVVGDRKTYEQGEMLKFSLFTIYEKPPDGKRAAPYPHWGGPDDVEKRIFNGPGSSLIEIIVEYEGGSFKRRMLGEHDRGSISSQSRIYLLSDRDFTLKYLLGTYEGNDE